MKNIKYALLGATFLLASSPAFADPTNITTGLNSITSWLLATAKPVAILALMGGGFMKFTGRMAWGYLVAIIVGVAIIFGAPQIVSWFYS